MKTEEMIEKIRLKGMAHGMSWHPDTVQVAMIEAFVEIFDKQERVNARLVELVTDMKAHKMASDMKRDFLSELATL